MKKKIIGLIVLTVVITSFTSVNDKGKIVKVQEFQQFIDVIGLKFTMPPNYEETYVKENNDLWYCFAMKDKIADFEARYTVWSLKPAIENYEKCKLDPSCVSVSPNVIYEGLIQANVLNMTGGQEWNIEKFTTQAVKEEFNADAGGASFFEFNCGFGKGYKYGFMVYLHKDDVADVIITFMNNDTATISELMEISFHALTFK